jgi:DNA-binding beta-propeller fold protein YncE
LYVRIQLYVDRSGLFNLLGFSGDGGQATSAKFYRPSGLAVDFATNRLFVSDSSNERIRVIDLSTGIVTTYMGDGARGANDGPISAARTNAPSGMAIDQTRRYLYFVEVRSKNIRRINLNTNTVATIMTDPGYSTVGNIYLDAENQKLYIGDNGYIWQANLTTNTMAKIAGAGMGTDPDGPGNN